MPLVAVHSPALFPTEPVKQPGTGFFGLLNLLAKMFPLLLDHLQALAALDNDLLHNIQDLSEAALEEDVMEQGTEEIDKHGLELGELELHVDHAYQLFLSQLQVTVCAVNHLPGPADI